MHSLDPVWETVKRQFEVARSESAQGARSKAIAELNQLLRRLRQYQTEGEWNSALLDGVSQFVSHVALFTFRDGVLYLRAQRNLNLAEDLSFPAAEAAAFETAIHSKDTVVALRSSSEVGEPLTSSDSDERAQVTPIMNGPRVVAVLFASNHDHTGLDAIELIAGLASTVLERQSNASLHTHIALQPLATAPRSSDPNLNSMPHWADLDEDQRALHVRAQRFARVKIAEMQLSRPAACRAGREQGNFYLFLRKEIDTARETYREQFMTNPSMVDYLHLELVRTAAGGIEQKLGADYPGQLL
jgi:hypothetical protein